MPRETGRPPHHLSLRPRRVGQGAPRAAGPGCACSTPAGTQTAGSAERQAAASQALYQIADGLGAELVAIWLPDARCFEAWVLTQPASEPARLPRQSLRSLPTVRQALRDGGLILTGCHSAPDLAALCQRTGFPTTGHFVLEPIAAAGGGGVLLAGRTCAAWSAVDHATVQTVARLTGNRLRASSPAISPSARGASRLRGPLGMALAPMVAAGSRLASSIVASRQLWRWASHRPRRPLAGDPHRARRPTPGTGPPVDPPKGRSAKMGAAAHATTGEVADAKTSGAARATTGDVAAATAAEVGRPTTGEVATAAAGETPQAATDEATRAAMGRVDPTTAGEPPRAATAPVDRPSAQPAVRGLSILSGSEPSAERPGHARQSEPAVPDQRSSTLAATRLECYALAIHELPWGLMLLDRENRVVAANRAAAHLLHVADIPPGMEAAALFPEPARASYALRSVAADPGQDQACQHLLFEASRLRADLQPLCHPVAGYAGAVVTLYRQTTLPASNAEPLLAQLATAMKTPLSSIVRYRDVLRRGRTVDESTARLAGRIEANLSRLQILLDDLTAAAALARDAAAEGATAIAVVEAVRESARRTGPQFAEKDVELQLTVHEPVPAASAQAAAAAIVVDNLLMNAARRSPPGSTVHIEVAAHNAGGDQGVIVTVTDVGPPPAPGSFGLLEVDCDGEDATLGLVRLLAERQGARAWAESHPHGTRFCVRFSARRRIA